MAGLLDVSAMLAVNPIALVLILLWSIIWKGLALWKSARKNSPVWFIILLAVNTIGILEILYIFVFSRLGKKPRQIKKSAKRRK